MGYHLSTKGPGGALVFRILKSRTDVFSVSGCISYQLRLRPCGRRFSVVSICSPRLCPRRQWDRLTCHFGRGLWESKLLSLIEQSLLSVMATPLASGRILGLVKRRWRFSIRPCIVLFYDVMLLLQRLCSPFPLIFSLGGRLLATGGKLGFIWWVDWWRFSYLISPISCVGSLLGLESS